MGRLVLKLCAVVAAIAMTGCYRPSVDACFLRCGDNNACPDGLDCNTQGICASSPTAMCGELPPDDSQQQPDSPPAVLTTITIDVQNADGDGQNDIRIVFSTPSGDLITETRTGTSGHVVVDNIPTGSAATIFRLTNASYNATTYTDLWENAVIVSRFAPTTATRPISVSWQVPPGNAPGVNYYPYTTCFTGMSFQTNTTWGPTLSNNCKKFDVIVIAKDNTGTPIYVVVVPDVTGGAPISITQSQWQAIAATSAYNFNFTNLPAGMNGLQLSGYATPAHAYTTPIAEASIPPSGIVANLLYPTQVPATLAIPSSNTIVGQFYQQLYVERLPLAETDTTRDMAMRKLPWINTATLDIPSKTIAFPAVKVGSSFADTAVAYARISFRRGSDLQAWHILSPGNRAVIPNGAQAMGTFVLPEIPGDNAFEPLASDTELVDEIMIFGATPGLDNALRGRIESHETTLDIFGIDGLSYVVRATAL